MMTNLIKKTVSETIDDLKCFIHLMTYAVSMVIWEVSNIIIHKWQVITWSHQGRVIFDS